MMYWSVDAYSLNSVRCHFGLVIEIVQGMSLSVPVQVLSLLSLMGYENEKGLSCGKCCVSSGGMW